MSSSVSNAVAGAVRKVAQNKQLGQATTDVLVATASKASDVAQDTLKNAPGIIGDCAALGASVGSILGPIGTFMGLGTGTVVGLVIAAATGKLE